jgi:hypothetical protein
MLCAGLYLAVTGCGGDGSSDVGTPPVGGTPTPTAGAGNTVFAAAALGPMIARISFDSNGSGSFYENGDVLSSTTIDGRFGRSVGALAPTTHIGTIPASATVRMDATGIDTTTALFFTQMRAPAGATVITPLTTLIDAAGSEARVRSALGLDTGTNALRGNVGLTTFNPALGLASGNADERHNALQLTRLNLQLLAMAAILKDTNGDPVDYSVTLLDSSRYMAQQIAATGQLNLTDPTTIGALLDRSRYQYGTPADQRDALAGLLARYNAAIPTDLADADAVRGWAWGFRFDVMVEFETLSSYWPNRDAARIAAIDAPQMRRIAAGFAALQAPVPAPFMATPDYAEVFASEDSAILSGCNGPTRRYPSCNDMIPFTFERATSTLVSATSSEPLWLAVDLSATATPIEPDFLRLRRLGTTFRGPVQVRYRSRLATGETSDGYLFVRVKTAGS